MKDKDTIQLREPLLPDRHPQQDFFVCDIFDAAPKGDMASMEHPLFALATRPDMVPDPYTNGQYHMEIIASNKGAATIFDRDIIIYCTSQIMAAKKQGRPISQTVHFQARDFFLATNRDTGGHNYRVLTDSLDRLRGTQIITNILTGGRQEHRTFGFIDEGRAVRETEDGRMVEVVVKLSDWVFDAIEANEVLTISRDYFRLRRPLERRIYEIGRKHCGQQVSWKIGIEKLKVKTGSKSSIRELRRLVKQICEQDALHSHMPDYAVSLDGGNLVYTNRNRAVSGASIGIALDPETIHDAKTILGRFDVYAVEHEWKEWMTEAPRDPHKAFLGFCRKWIEKRETIA